jgi:uncharacterized GH25 family protein
MHIFRPDYLAALFLSALAASLLLLPSALPAHDFWVEPSTFRPAVDEPVQIRLREGMQFKGDTLPYIPDWFRDFSVTDSAGTRQVVAVIGDDPAGTVIADDEVFLVGYQSNRAFTELDAAKFNSYLEEEGIEFIRQQRIAAGEDDQPAPEYFVRCAKTLVGSGAESDDVYQTELGYMLELIALDDPSQVEPGGKLRFQLKYRGEPAENLLVQAFSRAAPDQKQRIRTDAKGVAAVQITEAGVWMIKAVNIQPIVGDPKAKWQSYWASYLLRIAAANEDEN